MLSKTLPVLVTVKVKTNCSPTAAGLPGGFAMNLVTSTPGDTVVCGTPLVAGFTGTLLVVVGETSATLVPVPAASVKKRTVTVVVCPTAIAPRLVQLSTPLARLVPFAGGVCETIDRRLVRKVSVSGTTSRATVPLFVTAMAKTFVSPTTAGRPGGLLIVLLTPTDASTTLNGTDEVWGFNGMPLVVVALAMALFVETADASCPAASDITTAAETASGLIRFRPARNGSLNSLLFMRRLLRFRAARQSPVAPVLPTDTPQQPQSPPPFPHRAHPRHFQ